MSNIINKWFNAKNTFTEEVLRVHAIILEAIADVRDGCGQNIIVKEIASEWISAPKDPVYIDWSRTDEDFIALVFSKGEDYECKRIEVKTREYMNSPHNYPDMRCNLSDLIAATDNLKTISKESIMSMVERFYMPITPPDVKEEVAVDTTINTSNLYSTHMVSYKCYYAGFIEEISKRKDVI